MWDDLGRLGTDTISEAGSGVLHSLAYTYDPNSNPATKTLGPAGVAGEGTHTYTYDQADRLTSWTDPDTTTTDYTYDPAGNRLTSGSAAFTYDERNRLVTSADGHLDDTLEWTAAGTLASVTTEVGDTDVLFVVADSGSLTSDETALQDALAAGGHSVTVRNANAAESVGTAKAVVISPDVAAADLADKYAGTDLGVVNLAAGTWDDHLLASTTATVNGTDLDMVDSAHYVAAGLSGTVAATTTSGSISTTDEADLAPGATIVATGSNDDAAVFAVGEGAELNDAATSPGRRVAFGVGAVGDLDVAGEELLAAAVAWSLGGSFDTFGFDAFERMVESNGITLTYDAKNRVAARDGVAHQYAGLHLEPTSVGNVELARLGGTLLAQDLDGTASVPITDAHGDLIATLDPTAGGAGTLGGFGATARNLPQSVPPRSV